jgi:farnesyl diphosphate synthase
VNEQQHYFDARQQHINQTLARSLPNIHQEPQQLHQAISYAVLNGGKRLRPLLVYAVGETFGASLKQLDHAACAVEFIHAYSLIHDDLPAIDNDDFRRGQPSCHKAFGEAMAILAGDALQALAFEILAVANNERPFYQAAIATLAKACNAMVSGQALELATAPQDISIEKLETIHRLKTGALMRACVQLGALIAGANSTELQLLDSYADSLGLAFQIQDDIDDVEAATTYLSYVHCMGLDAAKQRLQQLREQALQTLTQLNKPAEPLHNLVHYMLN